MARRRDVREKERLIEVGVRTLVSGRVARTRRGSICVVMVVSLEVRDGGRQMIMWVDRKSIGGSVTWRGTSTHFEESDRRCVLWSLS